MPAGPVSHGCFHGVHREAAGGAAEGLTTILGSRQQLSPVSSRTRRGFLAISLISTRCQQKRAWEGGGRFGPWRGSLPAAAPPRLPEGSLPARSGAAGGGFGLCSCTASPATGCDGFFGSGAVLAMVSSSASAASPVWDEGKSPGEFGSPAPIALSMRTRGGFNPIPPHTELPPGTSQPC